ncbi:MFS transporter [Erwinia psidii]|uniref:MFS transporter n=1 Tax=Erwinia psidii TaxID=69224 RepID=A0A3N6S9Q9_9GAMM|nr:MFS transporter [Erwinia psidii]MCX8959291.1 MFS transporter [Erwinia psidii]MCX8962921.1 MFS transporter [Erwinia psidii]MCX8966067.1 MFS transporter [Erwinia psidii]RQM36713.1 MFS transporter [Erwinia psidii]
MKKILGTFLPLYTTTLLMLLGSGLLTTYVSLRLAHEHISGGIIGGITAANYIGLVIGGKVGHNLIARVGHIRAYVACAGIITASVLGHGITEYLPMWIFLRLIIGLCMMCQYMVLESWLNDQASTEQRGMIFGFYMAATYLGLSSGQIILMTQIGSGSSSLLIVALCFALCLVPIALTTRTNAQPMVPAPMELGYFFRTIPKILLITLITGMAVGAFYGMTPVYTSMLGFSTQQTGLFMGITIFAGLISQFPLAWLSDRTARHRLLRYTALLYALVALPLVLPSRLDFWWVVLAAFITSMMQFSLYPLIVAMANDSVMAERRVSLTACLLMAFGVGACIGPLITGVLMQPLGGNMLYGFFCICGIGIAMISQFHVSKQPVEAEATIPHVAMPDSLTSSPLVAALNPTIAEEEIQATMVNSEEDVPVESEQQA